MGALANLTPEERIGLGIAAAAHVALFAALAIHEQDALPQMMQTETIEVSLADEVSLASTAPDPSAAPQAAVAPVLAPDPAPEPPAEPVAQPEPQPVREPPPRPVERAPAPRPEPTRAARPTPAPSPSPTRAARPAPAPSPSRAARPSPAPTRVARPAPQPSAEPRRTGGSRLGSDFLEGTSAGERTERTGTPAATFGPAEAASLNSAIAREIKPHWSAPSGVDAEQLVTMVRFRLNRDGSLSGQPSCTSQSGVTPSNEAQKDLHCERAIRAVQLAAPFNLPDEFYDQWRLVTSRFDRRL